MVYTRAELKKVIAKLLKVDDFHDDFIVVNFIKAIYVLFGHSEWITQDEYAMMSSAYWDLEVKRCLCD